MKLELNTCITTVGFYADSPEYPTTDYGSDVDVKIKNHSEDGKEECVTVEIGRYLLCPSALEDILAEVKAFNDATKAYIGENRREKG
jgi:DNA-binding protein YbaB